MMNIDNLRSPSERYTEQRITGRGLHVRDPTRLMSGAGAGPEAG